MPWTPEQFSSKHNHKLRGKAARGASEVANKELAKGASDATAIRIGNAVGDRVLSHEGGGAVSKHWIQGAVKKPGELHRDLGVPQGEKIPAAKLAAAEHSSNPKVRQRAHFAENVKHFADGGPIKTFPIPSKPAPSGGEDNPKSDKGNPPYKPFPDESSSYARGGKIKSFAGGGALGNEGGVPLWPASGGQLGAQQFPGGGNTNDNGVDQKNNGVDGLGGQSSGGAQVVKGPSTQVSDKTKQSYACGGMIKHASYATGGPVGNTKSGFKSNAGDFH